MTGNIKTHPFFKTINWTLLEKRQVEPPFKPKVVRDSASFCGDRCPRGHLLSLPLSCVIHMLSPPPPPSKPASPSSLAHAVTASTLIASSSLPSLSHSINTGNSGSSHSFTYIF